jgi:hypothetical protein
MIAGASAAATTNSQRSVVALKTGDECTAATCKSTGDKKLIDTRALDQGQRLCWNCCLKFFARTV